MMNVPAAHNFQQMAMAMASLSIELQHAHLNEKSLAGEGVWLDAVRLHGGFDVAKDSGYAEGKINEIHALFEGALGFIKNFTYQWTDKDPVFGKIEPVEYAQYLGPATIRDAFVRLVDHFVEAEAARAKVKLPEGQEAVPEKSIAMLHSKLMGGAIVMNLPETVEKLARSCPLAVGHGFPKDLLGDNSKASKEHPGQINPTPYGLALMFSRIECLEALANHAHNQSLPIAMEFVPMQAQASECNLVRAFDFPDHHFLPGAFSVALTHALERPLDMKLSEVHLTAALKCLEHKRKPSEHHHLVPAYLAAGVYDYAPAESIGKAIEHGHPEVLAHFKGRIPWSMIPFDDETNSPIMRCLSEAQDNVREALHEDAILSVIEMAIVAREYERVMPTFARPLYVDGGTEAKVDANGKVTNLVDGRDDNDLWGPVDIEPITSIVNMGFDRVLVQMLNHGLDPSKPASPLPGSWTPLQIAESIPGKSVAIMRSHQARAKSFALLTEMEPATQGPRP